MPKKKKTGPKECPLCGTKMIRVFNYNCPNPDCRYQEPSPMKTVFGERHSRGGPAGLSDSPPSWDNGIRILED